MSRQEELLDAATDHVLEHGLIGLTLRPLAAALGTSDRMLVYHFGSRDALVSAVVARATERAVATVAALPAAPSVRSAVTRLWRAYQQPALNACLTTYCQAAATGLIGQEPYRSVARASNAVWAEALRDYLVRSGAPVRRVARIATLVDSALYGFHLDLTTDRPDELDRGVEDLASAVQALAG
ncbi:TetR/AcrR family transcriptional regulator [Nocardioides coralli]|uniref:TetR/AcrR family transcriptional regulator n=1 Tax=Nocardioides coralli TaxID=2872154 RepID=UPI001CA3FCED|nr:TetR/AcrR family transcriptional regulator [Nocardioides coralli]QZY28485.1 TetR/AcrR family transcriptional regulator [Nocardioides coralli]